MKKLIKVFLVIVMIVLAIPSSIYLYIVLSDFYYKHWGRWNEYENNVTKKYKSLIEGEPLVAYSYKVAAPAVGVYNYCYVAIFKLKDGVVNEIEKNNTAYLDRVTFDDVTENERFYDIRSTRNIIKTKNNLLNDKWPINWIKTPFPKTALPEMGFLSEKRGLRCFNYLYNIKNQDIHFVNGEEKKDLIKLTIDYGYNQEGYLQSYAVHGIARDSFWLPNEIDSGYTILIEPKLNLARISYHDGNHEKY